MAKKIGVLGLGNIGGSVTKRLLECGYDVTVYDIDEKKMNELHSKGAKLSHSMEELFSLVDYLITSLPNDEVVSDVLLKNHNFISQLNNLTLIELSTISPEIMKEIDNQYKNTGISIVDCPISGGPTEALQGALQLIVAGKQATVNKCNDIFDSISKDLLYVGEEIGTAKAIKLINNLMTMGNVLIASEAFALGMNYGIDKKLLYDTLSKTGGKSHHFIKRFPKVIANDYSAWFPISLGLKDLDLALKWAENQGIDLDVAKKVREFYDLASKEGLENKDIVSLTKFFHDKFENAYNN